MAARIRFSLAVRCAAVIRMSGALGLSGRGLALSAEPQVGRAVRWWVLGVCGLLLSVGVVHRGCSRIVQPCLAASFATAVWNLLMRS
jgi:hypothetical protein